LNENRLLLIIDVQNLFYSIRDLYGMNSRIDFLKIREISCRKSKCSYVDARVYLTSLKEDLKYLNDFLIYNGFDIRVKELNNAFKVKGDVDTQIVADTIPDIKKYQQFVICSGDSDFIPLVNAIKQQSKEVGIISFDRTSSKKLEECANWSIHLDERIVLK
jgi:uncharacterized LabA/DUF88 family protein